MENHLRAASLVANLLDNRFNFLGIKFGLNGLLGLIPGFGDIITGILSFYLVWIGVKMRLPASALGEMVGNVAANFLIGLIPVVGDFADFFHRGNLKNLRILKEYAKSGVVEGEVINTAKQLSYR
jgi:hypothetical protein